MTVTVAAVNDAPVANNDSLTATEDTAVIYTAAQLLGNDTDADGNTLTIASVTSGTGGTAMLNGDGTVTFTPNANFNGTADFTYTVTDGTLTSNSATVTVTVAAVNDDPTPVNDALSTSEDSSLTIIPATLLANDTDIDGDALTITSVQGAVNGSVALVAGNVVFTPAANFSGAASFTYTVSDGQGGSNTATVNVTVAPVNDAPTASGSTVTTAEDTPVGVNLSGTDLDGTIASVSVTALPASGTLFLADGVTAVAANTALTAAQAASLLYVPAANASGSVSLQFTVTDNGGLVSPAATTTIVVTPVNDAPTTAADARSTVEGSTALLASVLANDSDTEGSALSVTTFAASIAGTAVAANGSNSITTALGGTVTMNANGSFTYTAPVVTHDAANTPVVDSFVYRAGDGSDSSAWTTVTLNLNDTTPIATSENGTVAWSSTLTGNILANDSAVDQPTTLVSVNGTAIAASGTTTLTTTNGTLAIAADGSFTYTSTVASTATATGSDEADFRASLGGLWGFDTATWASGSNLSLAALASQSDLVSYQGGSKPGLAVNNAGIEGGEHLILRLPESTTSATIALNQLNSSQPTAMWSAYDASGVLVASGSFGAGPANGSTSLQTILTATPFSYLRLSNSATSGQGFRVASVEYGLLPANHIDSFSYTMRDGDGDTSSATLAVRPGTTSIFDSPPVSGGLPSAAGDSINMSEDTPFFGSVAGNDTPSTDGGNVWSVAGSPTHGNLSFNVDGSFNYTPDSNYVGADSFSYRITDADGSVSTATVTIAVAPVNDVPVVAANSVATAEDTALVISAASLLANDSDADGDTLTITSVQGAVNGTVALVAGNIVFTPAPDYNGPASFTYTVSDGNGGSAIATVDVNVGAVNDAPVARNDVLSSTEDSVLTISAASLLGNDSDADGNALTIASVTSGAGGTAVLNGDGTVTFTPNAHFNGAADFTYTVSDGVLTSNPATVTVNVAAVNDAPTAVADIASTPINTALSNIDVLGNDSDVDGDALTVTAASLANAAQGSVSINADGTLNFTPANNVSGNVLINYTIADGQGGSASSTLTVAVGSNSPPTGSDATLTLLEDTSRAFTAADFGFADADAGQTLANVRIDSLPGNGTLSLSGGPVLAGQIIAAAALGGLVFTPAAHANGAGYASFTFSVQDNAGAFDSAPNSITFDVTAVNDAPVAVNDSLAASEDTAVIYTAAQLLGNDTDADGDTLTIASVTSGAGGTAVLNANGTVTFTPNANFNGTADFTYTVTDGTVTSNTATVSVTVAAANDAPVANNDSLTATEDTAVTYTAAALLGNDTDADGNTLTIASVTSGTGGTAVLNGDGTVTFTPNANFNGTADFTYTVTDGSLTSNAATVSVTVAAANDAPVANNDSLIATEDTAVIYTAAQLLGNDSDADGNTLTIASVTSGTGGTAVLNGDGTVTFTPNANFNGTADFTYTVTDGALTSNTATVTVTVAAVNDAPLANNDSLTATEDTAVIYTAAQLLGNDTDADGNTLTIASVTSRHRGHGCAQRERHGHVHSEFELQRHCRFHVHGHRRNADFEHRYGDCLRRRGERRTSRQQRQPRGHRRHRGHLHRRSTPRQRHRRRWQHAVDRRRHVRRRRHRCAERRRYRHLHAKRQLQRHSRLHLHRHRRHGHVERRHRGRHRGRSQRRTGREQRQPDRHRRHAGNLRRYTAHRQRYGHRRQHADHRQRHFGYRRHRCPERERHGHLHSERQLQRHCRFYVHRHRRHGHVEHGHRHRHCRHRERRPGREQR